VTGLGIARGGRAIDPTLQAAMGMMALTGEPDGPPMRLPVPLIDFMTGMYAAQSVIAALWRAERGGTGAFLDCALVDAAAALTSVTALLGTSGAIELGPIGSGSYLAVPSAVFRASDGEHVQVVAVNQRHWTALAEALGHPEWRDDPRCADEATRLANRDHVHGLIEPVIATRPSEEWVERLTAAGAFCERVRPMEEAWTDPLLAERGLAGRLDGEGFGGAPFPVVSLARTADAARLAPGPALGQHTDAVLGEL
jgi:crotonobetainyl-CoA:carnitine CoA-transferase CaiB-like acyl-CoA transferase